jgi:hypothetical protein
MGYQIGRLVFPLTAILLLFTLAFANTAVAVGSENLAFPDKFMFRLAAYSIQDAETDFTILSEDGFGTGLGYTDDLGGDNDDTVPRLDIYYRLNDRHRIDFTHFKFERDGRKRLEIEVEIEDEIYSVGETVVSSISYELFKVGYAYTFYHSPQVELGVTTGLNVTTYEFDFELEDGSSESKSKATAPLPMFGLKMSFAINSRWSLHYLSEIFFIEIGDSFEGVFLNNELNLEYRFENSFALGLGVTRHSIDVSSDDDDLQGEINDSAKGVLIFTSYYF